MSGTYDRWNTPAILQMFANDDDAHAAAHLAAWDSKWQLLYDQSAKLTALRDQLIQHWDPTGSPAAQAFVDRIDAMIRLVDGNRAAAAGIRQTYEHVTAAMREARKQIEPLASKYYNHKAAADSQTLLDKVQFWDQSPAAVQGRYQQDVDKQARAIMEVMDQRVTEATANPRAISTFPQQDIDHDVQPVTDSSSTSGNSGSSSSSSSITQPPFNPPPTSATVALPTDGGPDGGPALAGTPAPSPQTFPSPPSSPPIIGPSPGATPVIGVPPGAFRSPTEVVSAKEPLPGPKSPRFGGVIGEPSERPVATSFRQPSVPTDGVIRGGPVEAEGRIRGGSMTPMTDGGAAPSTGARRGSSTSRRASRGPVIGEASDTATPRRTAAGWQDLSYEAYAKRRAKRKDDPDNQWTVEEGVAPVLEAPSDWGDHSAPTGVIGLDR